MEDEMEIWWVLVAIQVWVYAGNDAAALASSIEKFQHRADCESMMTTLNGQRQEGDGKVYVCVPYHKKKS